MTLTATLTHEGDRDTKEFTFKVAGKQTRAYEMPLPLDTIFYDDFEDGVINSQLEPVPGSGSVTEENGVLHVFFRVF